MRIIVIIILLSFSITAVAALPTLAAPKIPYKRVCDCTCSGSAMGMPDIRVDGDCSGLEGGNCATYRGKDREEFLGTMRNCRALTVPIPRDVSSAQNAELEAPDIETIEMEGLEDMDSYREKKYR